MAEIEMDRLFAVVDSRAKSPPHAFNFTIYYRVGLEGLGKLSTLSVEARYDVFTVWRLFALPTAVRKDLDRLWQTAKHPATLRRHPGLLRGLLIFLSTSSLHPVLRFVFRWTTSPSIGYPAFSNGDGLGKVSVRYAVSS